MLGLVFIVKCKRGSNLFTAALLLLLLGGSILHTGMHHVHIASIEHWHAEGVAGNAAPALNAHDGADHLVVRNAGECPLCQHGGVVFLLAVACGIACFGVLSKEAIMGGVEHFAVAQDWSYSLRGPPQLA